MAEPLLRENMDWEGSTAAVSMAGVRPLTLGSVSVSSSSENTYTVQDQSAKRVLFVHDASGNEDIRFDLGATATASSFPIVPGVYFVVEAVKDEVLHFFNTTGGAITVNIMEIR